jgi:hypothetical protein
MNSDLEQRLRHRINQLTAAVVRAEQICERETARAWELECRVDELERENVGLLAEIRRLRQDLSLEGLEG